MVLFLENPLQPKLLICIMFHVCFETIHNAKWSNLELHFEKLHIEMKQISLNLTGMCIAPMSYIG